VFQFVPVASGPVPLKGHTSGCSPSFGELKLLEMAVKIVCSVFLIHREKSVVKAGGDLVPTR